MTAKPLSKRKRLIFRTLFVGILTFVFFIVAEIIAIGYFTAKNRKYVSVAELHKQEYNSFIVHLTKGKKDCAYVDALFPHPYLGFVYNANPPCGFSKDVLNSFGFHGQEFPLEKSKDKYYVMISGGSVANQFALKFKDGLYLEDILNKEYINPKGKPFVVLNGGQGAWKQPQQAITFLLFGKALDAFVTLDGYNEQFALNLTGDMRFEAPGNNFMEVNPILKSNLPTLMAGMINNKVYNFTRHNWFFSNSHSAYLASKVMRTLLRVSIVGRQAKIKESTPTTFQSIFRFPATWSPEKKRKWAAEEQKKYFRLINHMARSVGVRTAHFIQPVPFIGKQLTPEEKKWTSSYPNKASYMKMVQNLKSLNRERIPVMDLLYVFENEKDAIYSDNIHCIREGNSSRGYKLMAQAMARKLAPVLGLRRK